MNPNDSTQPGENSTPSGDKPRVIDPLDKYISNAKPLAPIGAGKKAIAGGLQPTLSKPKPLRNPNDKPKDKSSATKLVIAAARKQITCPVVFDDIEAKMLSDNQYRLNFLVKDANTASGGSVIFTYTRPYSVIVNVAWNKDAIILTVKN